MQHAHAQLILRKMALNHLNRCTHQPLTLPSILHRYAMLAVAPSIAGSTSSSKTTTPATQTRPVILTPITLTRSPNEPSWRRTSSRLHVCRRPALRRSPLAPRSLAGLPPHGAPAWVCIRAPRPSLRQSLPPARPPCNLCGSGLPQAANLDSGPARPPAFFCTRCHLHWHPHGPNPASGARVRHLSLPSAAPQP